MCFLFFKPKTAYAVRISDWSSDVSSSDLSPGRIERLFGVTDVALGFATKLACIFGRLAAPLVGNGVLLPVVVGHITSQRPPQRSLNVFILDHRLVKRAADRSEEHTSELQSLMRISYAVFCLKKKNTSHSY